MEYLKWITSSTTYTVPKAGKYKIICVGGGASGGVAVHDKEPANTKALQAAGKTTSFGSYLSATGGQPSVPTFIGKGQYTSARFGGQSGYDGINYGSAGFGFLTANSSDKVHTPITHISIGNNSPDTGHGYGAGGGAVVLDLATAITLATSYTKAILPVPGACGEIKSSIVDLNEGERASCTIGKGGVFASDVTTSQLQNYILTVSGKSSFTSYSVTPSSLSDYVTSGASGVIIVQYLG